MKYRTTGKGPVEWAVVGATGVEGDALLDIHQADLHHQPASSWGWTTTVTDGCCEGIFLLHSTKTLLVFSSLDAAALSNVK